VIRLPLTIQPSGIVDGRRIIVMAVASIAIWVYGAGPSPALENLKVFRGALILEGKIDAGDYVAVRSFLRNESNFKKITNGVFLASPGGNVREALKIGYLIRALQLSTEAPSIPPREKRAIGSSAFSPGDLTNPQDFQCTSACFLIYVAGVERKLNWVGRLGVHQPRLQAKPLGASESDTKIASMEMRGAIKIYLDKMNVPNKYLELIYSVPSNYVRWITQQEFDADLRGYIPEVRASLQAKCDMPHEANKSGKAARCAGNVLTELRSDAWQKVFAGN
jgi:hypothetical protein